MRKSLISLLVILVLILSFGFYYQNNILNFYNNTSKGIQDFEKNDLDNILKEVKKEIFTSSPLKIGGKPNEAVFTKEKIIAHTNIQRYNNDLLVPLIENSKLNASAKAKAEDMFLNQYFEHTSPSGVDPGRLVRNYGYDYIITGENLILGNFLDEKELVQKWMDSPGHRANILNNRFTEIGVAIIKGIYKGETVWIGVQEFGLPLSSCIEPNQNLKNKIEVNKNRLDQLSYQIDLKKFEVDNANPRSENYNKLINEYNKLVNEYNLLGKETKNIITEYNNQINIFNDCIKGTN